MVRTYARVVGLAARLLFVAVLALGVLVMHTVGHPSDGSGTAAGSSSHAAAMGSAPGSGTATTGHHPDDTITVPAGHSSVAAALAWTTPVAPGATAVPVDGPGMAMDMASLCLAVLGTWALSALLYAIAVGRRGWLTALSARVLAVVRPNPPPMPPDLAQLSVLRI
ncbi:hypothetical protein [Streptomyces erythrochromogenes]|uniref:hypothetical protein n=1 Tax=Streptomyces erythrochromogenes TaxID=285574 RepID=UPI002250A969|nr:hypothetical protein [Streptomyces erythrochromogenes]MCX5582950.1 hypothetical protein [Streptomyces erythrochromogenes]